MTLKMGTVHFQKSEPSSGMEPGCCSDVPAGCFNIRSCTTCRISGICTHACGHRAKAPAALAGACCWCPLLGLGSNRSQGLHVVTARINTTGLSLLPHPLSPPFSPSPHPHTHLVGVLVDRVAPSGDTGRALYMCRGEEVHHQPTKLSVHRLCLLSYHASLVR